MYTVYFQRWDKIEGMLSKVICSGNLKETYDYAMHQHRLWTRDGQPHGDITITDAKNKIIFYYPATSGGIGLGLRACNCLGKFLQGRKLGRSYKNSKEIPVDDVRFVAENYNLDQIRGVGTKTKKEILRVLAEKF